MRITLEPHARWHTRSELPARRHMTTPARARHARAARTLAHEKHALTLVTSELHDMLAHDKRPAHAHHVRAARMLAHDKHTRLLPCVLTWSRTTHVDLRFSWPKLVTVMSHTPETCVLVKLPGNGRTSSEDMQKNARVSMYPARTNIDVLKKGVPLF